MRTIWRTILVLWLALCVSAPAFALGLGQLQVRSQAGEPLLAEIPVVSSDPRELQQLRARLASPDTFTRVGLQAPQGAVADLQFNVALDAQGRPVIRVTTLRPVAEPLLTFLVEVDWGQGRLVREYSALLDAPDTVAAPAQPPIQAPQPAASATTAGTIAREAPPRTASRNEARPDDERAPAPPIASSTPTADAAAGDAVPVQASPPPAPATALRSTPGEYGPVQAGDTLSQIVQRIAPDDDVTVNQMMLALLRSNPEAFIGGNINRIRQGAVLRVPGRDEALSVGVREATAEVRTQVARWRDMTQPVATPDAVAAADAGTDDAGAAAPATTAAARDARLEIVPPGQGGTNQAGTRSGIAAGGEGDMLRQEFQQAQETLAARDAELDELKARLTELEALQRQQQELIELKDSELAAAQARLADSNQRESGGGSALPWVGGLLLGLLAAGLLVWWLARRDAARPVFRAPAGHVPPAPPAVPPPAPAPAGGRPTWHAGGGASTPGAAPSAVPTGTVADAGVAAGAAALVAPVVVVSDRDVPPSPPDESGVPDERTTSGFADDFADAAMRGTATPADDGTARPAEPQDDVQGRYGHDPLEARHVPDAHVAAPGAAAAGVPDARAPDAPERDAQGRERIELAQAYVELGDTETARDLLREALHSDSPAVRGDAARLLDSLD